MPRPPRTSPTVRWVVYIPEALAAEIELILLDPVRHKARFGARGELITTLLRQWLRLRQPIAIRKPADA